MSVFEFPTPGATFDEIVIERNRVQDYIRAASDPDEAGPNGQTLLTLALLLCFEGQGEEQVWDLLRRGANPNRPSAWINFCRLLTVSNSPSLVKEFLDRGLRLNDVYEEVEEQTGGLVTGPVTLLDYTYAVRDYIAPKQKKINALANRYAGGLGKRRKFIDATIALLETAGAKRIAERN